jgi:hypothetical protein
MTLTIDLTPEEERRVEEAARAKGIDVQALLKSVIAGLPSPVSAEERAGRWDAIFAQWEKEDASLTPEELAQAQAEWEALKANMNANRAATGEEPVFK